MLAVPFQFVAGVMVNWLPSTEIIIDVVSLSTVKVNSEFSTSIASNISTNAVSSAVS